MKKKIDLIIFDFDGTLVDSKNDIIISVNEMLEKIGLPRRAPSQIQDFIGSGVKKLVQDALGKNGNQVFDRAVDMYKDIYRKHMFDTTVLYPGTVDVLKHFKNAKKAIISNKSIEFIKMSLERFGIASYFAEVFGGDHDRQRKPSPQPIIKMLQDFKVKPQRAVIVGDSQLDIEAGVNAGVLTCGALYGIGKKEEIVALRPDFLINSILELKDVLE